MPCWSDSCQIGLPRDPCPSWVAAGDQLGCPVAFKMAVVACVGTTASNLRSLLTTVEWNVACMLRAICRSKFRYLNLDPNLTVGLSSTAWDCGRSRVSSRSGVIPASFMQKSWTSLDDLKSCMIIKCGKWNILFCDILWTWNVSCGMPRSSFAQVLEHLLAKIHCQFLLLYILDCWCSPICTMEILSNHSLRKTTMCY